VTVIYLATKSLSLRVDLNDSSTADQLLAALPFEGTVNTWGDEIYFETPVAAKLEKGAKALVEVGDVAYWPPGKALCVFFGPTPASTGDEPRAASPVTRVGRVAGDLGPLREVRDGARIRVSRDPGKEK
jgi:hypothetical protein